MPLNFHLLNYNELEEIANAMKMAYQQHDDKKCALFGERQIANSRNQQTQVKLIQEEIDFLKHSQNLLTTAYHKVTGNQMIKA